MAGDWNPQDSKSGRCRMLPVFQVSGGLMATAIGIVAGLCVITSMLLRSERWIKALLLAGALLFLTYGIILELIPIIMLNSVGAVIGTREVIRLWCPRKNRPRDR